MTYPTLEQVKDADRYRVCTWWRFLPSPTTDDQLTVMNEIAAKFKEFGGFTPEISKSIGWEK